MRPALMCGEFRGKDDCAPGYDSTRITAEQAETMKDHRRIVD
jgi:hypothetical protein